LLSEFTEFPRGAVGRGPGVHAVHCHSPPGTCKGVHGRCLAGICQAPNVTGGQACGQWEEVNLSPPIARVSSDLRALKLGDVDVVLSLRMWAADLYTMQFVCS
jgi:hypothetical protein